MGAGRYARAIAGEPTDEALVTAAQGGDREAMDTLLRRHQDRLWAVCRRLAGNDADAADALQEAMVLIVRRLDTFDGRARFTTWAHRVATNACLDELRRRGRRPVLGLPDDDPDLGDGAMIVDRAAPVDHEIAERLSVDDALAQLPDEFRLPVVLRDLGGHDYAEIAAILDIPAGTVRSRIARARGRLAQLLDLGDEPGEAESDPGNQPPSDRRPSSQP
ncbi:RNA polymerase sigma factor [Actinospongicola halichondriae]|uniref:RNA polymerase sigma factor n=1 Tax=Actinospongicola halichondriae TaxID=3236844 RepID=UPI003D5A308E